MSWRGKAAFSAALFLSFGGVCAAQTGPQDGDPHWLTDPRTGCAIFDSDPHPGDLAAWSGACVGGRASGAGTVVYSNDGKVLQSLAGDFQDGKVLDGPVTIKWGDGSSYSGGQSGGEFAGRGVFVTAKGDRLDGEWAHNRLNGQGTVRWANGDTYTGGWLDGKSEGHGVQLWADGRKYEGEWHADQPNGHGILTRKDGSRYEGEFAGGKPLDGTKMAAAAVSPKPAQLVAAQTKPVTDDPQSMAPDGSPWVMFAPFAGQKLAALDGSSVSLEVSDNALSRVIVAPDGQTRKSVFALMNGLMGTVADGAAPDKPVGFFRLTPQGIEAEYADGRSERLMANTGGGVAVASRAKDGGNFCMAWYPDGHVYSDAEKKAALAEYAGKLGLARDARSSAAPAACTPAPARPAQTARTPVPRPRQQAQAADTLQPVVVRASLVHPVDGGTAALSPRASVSDCLHVESDGSHWGFRNDCARPVQFAYCIWNGGNALSSCDKGAAPGSVAANGFAALFSDRSLKEIDADHDFRWVACEGGAGEVIAHLDSADPPSGRCVRSNNS